MEGWGINGRENGGRGRGLSSFVPPSHLATYLTCVIMAHLGIVRDADSGVREVSLVRCEGQAYSRPPLPRFTHSASPPHSPSSASPHTASPSSLASCSSFTPPVCLSSSSFTSLPHLACFTPPPLACLSLLLSSFTLPVSSSVLFPCLPSV